MNEGKKWYEIESQEKRNLVYERIKEHKNSVKEASSEKWAVI